MNTADATAERIALRIETALHDLMALLRAIPDNEVPK